MLTLTKISKTYEGQPLLTDLSLTVHAGETICLLGASGSGKSTLLRIIAGLETPETGRVSWDDMDLAPVPPHTRDFGLVFQDYALFPHLTVFENVAFGLRMRNLPVKDIRPRVAETLDLVNLRGFDSRRVTDLSGGEQQRVALARALAPRPRLLMFDEPLGALDRTLKEDLLHELREILHTTHIPAIYVTHDQEEAFAIADRILLLHAGQIVREGTPVEVWAHPGSAWVAKFLGVGNVVEGKTSNVERSMFNVETEYGNLSVHCEHGHADGEKVVLLLKQNGGGVEVRARVEDVVFNREQFRVKLRGGLVVALPRAPEIGSEVSVAFAVECLGHA